MAGRAGAEHSPHSLNGIVRGYVRRLIDQHRANQSWPSRRISFSSSLIRTRIETTLARQSRDLLESMNQRTKLQVRLQQTVEGLSVLAISYYALGILGYVGKAVDQVWRLSLSIGLGIAAPVVVATVWYSVRALRKSWDAR